MLRTNCCIVSCQSFHCLAFYRLDFICLIVDTNANATLGNGEDKTTLQGKGEEEKPSTRRRLIMLDLDAMREPALRLQDK